MGREAKEGLQAKPIDGTRWVNLTVVVGRILVDADPVVVAAVTLVTAEEVASVHLVVAGRALRDTGLLEAALGVLAFGARDDIVLPVAHEVVAAWDAIVVCMVHPDRDYHVVGVLAALSDATLIPSRVFEAELVAATAAVLVPGAVGDAVV